MAGEAKVLTAEDVRAWVQMKWERVRVPDEDFARVRATVEALDAERARADKAEALAAKRHDEITNLGNALDEAQARVLQMAEDLKTVETMRQDTARRLEMAALLHQQAEANSRAMTVAAEANLTLAEKNSDGWVLEVERRERAEARVKVLEAALSTVLDSAFPNPDEHPAMTRAWKIASAVLEAR
jgi:predicted  nucleic acid-binding Zn-ribbon protein